MANEKRLIDANALIAEYDRVHIGPPGGARKLMEDAPSVDAVEVVRCKECVEWKTAVTDKKGFLICLKTGMSVMAHDYCSHGERST